MTKHDLEFSSKYKTKMDLVFTFKYVLNCKWILVYDKVFYNYYIRKNSLSRSFSFEKSLVHLRASELIYDYSKNFKSQIIEKNLTIQFVFDKNRKFLVRSYYTNLIVDNLLSNAIKYSSKNSTIRISLNEQRNHVNFTIQDEGIGIKENDLNHIYENFYRSEALNHKDISGNGLGLSIVKKSADAIDAKVMIESKLDIGTTASVIF